MKRNGSLISILSIFLALSAYATVNVAYGEDKEQHDGRKEARKGDDRELAKGVPHAVTLRNLSNIPLKEIEIRFSGKDRNDFNQTNDCHEQLAERASCTINVIFAPKSPGEKAATLEVDTSGGKQIVYLTGTGI